MTGSVFPDHVVALFGKNTPIASVPKFVSATKAQDDRNWQVPAQTDLPTEALNGVSLVVCCRKRNAASWDWYEPAAAGVALVLRSGQ